ncbi:MAG: phosphatidylserine synthase [Flavobacteriaceae bacterium]|nr:phosphatidylserine synthase [Flavobacteriaceae bacterium]MBT3754017.1 phosphatidylserine synthase [Flavobacteriaceae bacterium]MBT3794050.1 phosphatidylserine synthase [Flavobacteriaceae bacterium]MBT4062473.1 phosphatidylserine synthase [Flavobacteriaceae bacterium]MBT4245909.1 phosphatidylserine synthase [Flavobacteriaceae bacterium]
MKLFSFIPNTFTLLNLFFGCIAVVHGIYGDLKSLAFFVVLGLICDFFDGFFARLFKIDSKFGIQLDSLSDLVTFGMTSSIVMLNLIGNSSFVLNNSSHSLISLTPYLAFIITLASSYRLAKFNINSINTEFVGLPTPANAILIVFIPVFFEQINKLHYLENIFFLISIIIISSYLLVCDLKMFSLKLKNLKFKENRLVFVFIALSIVLFLTFKMAAFPLTILLYIFINLFRIKI